MVMVNIHEAKTTLSKLLKRVAGGEEFLIARAGRPIARVVPYRERGTDRTPGRDRGVLEVPGDFDSPLPPETLAGFES